MRYAIVETDNFNGDYPDEKFLLRGLTEGAAKKIAAIVNDELCESRFWKVVEEPYTLQPGFEP